MKDVFFQEKGKLALLALSRAKKPYVLGVAREINCTYAHTFNLLREMQGQGILRSKKDGRTKYLALTPKGKQLAALLHRFVSVLGSNGRKKSKGRAKRR